MTGSASVDTVQQRQVLIMQTYLPSYRMAMFERLRHELAQDDIKLTLVHGLPQGGQSLRGDATTLAWSIAANSRSISIGSRKLAWLESPALGQTYDLVIMEQALANWRLWRGMVLGDGAKTRVALWGHGRIRTRPSSCLEQTTLRRLSLRADHFFAYTDEVREEVASWGYARSRITSLQNTVDTEALKRCVERLESSPQVRPSLPAALYLGALDESKDLPVLLESARLISLELPKFQLHVVGTGRSAGEIEAAARECSYLAYHGRIDAPEEKARIASRCQCMLLTGRVGLAAVEGLAMGLPIVATRYGLHAPEICYVRSEENGLIADRSPTAIARAVVALLGDEDRLNMLSQGAIASGADLSMNAMVERYHKGIRAALSHPVRRRSFGGVVGGDRVG